MQIHELNPYSGSFGSGAFLAVDNGTDTGKLSTEQLLAETEANIESLNETLNARIDNIIAGGDAPSEAEIIDARLGYNGAVYGSLGAAIRGQAGSIANALNALDQVAVRASSVERSDESFDLDFGQTTVGRLQSDGNSDGNADYVTSDFIPLNNVKYIYRYGTTSRYNLEAYALYDANKDMIPGSYHPRTTDYTFETYDGHNDAVFYDLSANGAEYIRISKDITLNYYHFEYVSPVNTEYVIDGKISSENIDATEALLDSTAKIVSNLDVERIENKAFVKFIKGMSGYPNTYIDGNGNVYSGDSYSDYFSTPYIETAGNANYKSLNVKSVNFYDENKIRISGSLVSDRMINGEYRFTTPATAKYFRICFYTVLAVNTYGVVLENSDYDVVCLGDSIFGGNPICGDAPTFAQVKTGLRFANCAYGGTTAGKHSSTVGDEYNNFAFYHIADMIDSENYTDITSLGNLSNFYQEHTRVLSSVDFSKVSVITVAYGTNDWNFDKQIDNSNNKYDTATYCGGLRYGIEKILSKYPHICIMLMAPIFRVINNAPVDNMVNGNGDKLIDFIDAMKSVAEEYHLPFFNHYDIGFNILNYSSFLRDDTHLNYERGAKQFGALVGTEVDRQLQ